MQTEGPVGGQPLVHVHFRIEVEVSHKGPCVLDRAAAHRRQGDGRCVQSRLDGHQGSRLLPGEQSAEVAQEGEH